MLATCLLALIDGQPTTEVEERDRKVGALIVAETINIYRRSMTKG